MPEDLITLNNAHIKKVSTMALVSGDANCQVTLEFRNLDLKALDFINAIVSTPKNMQHELTVTFNSKEI